MPDSMRARHVAARARCRGRTPRPTGRTRCRWRRRSPLRRRRRAPRTSPGRRFPRGRCASPASRGRARVAGISVLSALPPHTSLAPLASASSISALQCSTVLMPITEPSTTGSGLRGSPSGRLCALAANFATNSSAIFCVDDDALGRHADLARVGEGAEGGGVHRGVEVGVVEHHQRRLAAELEHHRLQVLGAGHARSSRPTRVRAGEVDAPHRRVRDHRLDHRARIGRRVGHVVHHAGRKARFLQRLDDQLVRARAQFSLPLSTTVLPQASGVAIARTPRMTGAFHGAMPSTTPAGCAHAHGQASPARPTGSPRRRSAW